MESKGRNVWMPIAIVAIIVALLLACLLAALGCAAMTLMARRSSSSQYDYEYVVPVPQPEVTRVPEIVGGGATITYVEPGGPAELAGLTRGDVITAVDSVRIGLDQDLADVIGTYDPGDTITIEYRHWRTGQSDTTTVRLGEHPDDSSRPYLGIEYSTTPFFDGDFGD
ncbi:MAG: PDZ domain-containing protein [Anaerolineae bacterium]